MSTKLPMLEKWVDKAVGVWFVFGVNRTDQTVDISDGRDDVFTGLPPEVARLAIAAHDRFREELYRILCDKPERSPIAVRNRPRTVADVQAARATPTGCCDRHTDHMACDCLERAWENKMAAFAKAGPLGVCSVCGGTGEIRGKDSDDIMACYACGGKS